MFRSVALCFFGIFLTVDVSSAQVTSLSRLPDGLSPGDEFRYVFVTDGARDATSSAIEDYDNFVTNEANATGSLFFGEGLTFQAIGSTATVNAVDHIATGGSVDVPFVLVGGGRVAANSADFFDGQFLVNIDQSESGGAVAQVLVYTGSLADGTVSDGFGLGQNEAIPATNVGVGTTRGFGSVTASRDLDPRRFYGISSVVTAVAEPSITGDFDRDGDVDADDIDFYNGNLGQPASFNPELDLNNDEMITLADHDQHVATLVQTSNGETGAVIGDANLDGTVNVLGDALALVTSLGNTGPLGYADGDLNADGVVNVLGDAIRLVGNLGLSNAQ